MVPILVTTDLAIGVIFGNGGLSPRGGVAKILSGSCHCQDDSCKSPGLQISRDEGSSGQ